MIPQLKHGPFGRLGGVDVWVTWIPSLSYCWLAMFAWNCRLGNLVHDMSIGTGWLFMLLGALDKLYCGIGGAALC